jgi:hypothetical protein
MILIDDDGQAYNVPASECEEDESGQGVWCCFDEDYVDTYFEYCGTDLDEESE